MNDNINKYNEMKKMKKEILKLNKTDWESICKSILLPSNEKITITKRGVFFCLLNISEESINKINSYIRHKKKVIL